MENRHVGYIIIGLSVLLAFIVYSYDKALESIVSTTCGHGEACPMVATIDTQRNISLGLIGALAVVGLYISFFLQDVKKRAKTRLSTEMMTNDEKRILKLLQENKGSVFQSEIVKELGASKVKVTRLLDGLESKKIIERKRRGMSNLVVLRE